MVKEMVKDTATNSFQNVCPHFIFNVFKPHGFKHELLSIHPYRRLVKELCSRYFGTASPVELVTATNYREYNPTTNRREIPLILND